MVTLQKSNLTIYFTNTRKTRINSKCCTPNAFVFVTNMQTNNTIVKQQRYSENFSAVLPIRTHRNPLVHITRITPGKTGRNFGSQL